MADRSKGVLSNGRYRMDGSEKAMEMTEKYRYGEKDHTKGRNRERGIPIFYQQPERRD